MYDIGAIVTVATPTELKLKANWPRVWLRVTGSIEIRRQLLAGETWGPPLTESVQQVEIDGNRANWPNLRIGDRVIVRLFFPGESR
jgi:hypothetical protein